MVAEFGAVLNSIIAQGEIYLGKQSVYSNCLDIEAKFQSQTLAQRNVINTK